MKKDCYANVEIREVARDGQTGNNTVVLYSPKEKIWLPIIIGPSEGYNIAMWLNKLNVPRPGVYDLVKNVMEMNDMTPSECRIYLLKNNAYYAQIYGTQERKNKMFHTYTTHDFKIDARPSDCLAIGLLYNIPIKVHKDILNTAGLTDEALKIQDAMQQAYYNQSPGAMQPGLRNSKKTKLEILHEKLDFAVDNEDFEEAAVLRDQIKKVLKEQGIKDRRDSNDDLLDER